jgi:hypothetical protein
MDSPSDEGSIEKTSRAPKALTKNSTAEVRSGTVSPTWSNPRPGTVAQGNVGGATSSGRGASVTGSATDAQ